MNAILPESDNFVYGYYKSAIVLRKGIDLQITVTMVRLNYFLSLYNAMCSNKYREYILLVVLCAFVLYWIII